MMLLHNRFGHVFIIFLISEQLPTWIVSAMRCLAYWPDRVVDTMPSYPGFEVDVFKVVRDHLLSLKEPLLTSAMYEVFTNVFCK